MTSVRLLTKKLAFGVIGRGKVKLVTSVKREKFDGKIINETVIKGNLLRKNSKK